MSTDRNILLRLSYDGSQYCGWQIQPNGLTIQECVERAVEQLTGMRSHVLCAGRTDSGVHALGQAASFRTNSRIPPQQFCRGLQNFLPRDIVVIDSQEVSAEFHATYSAVSKTYRYVLFDGAVCPPFLEHRVCRSRVVLNVQAMQQAVPYLLGTHDFRCFETHYPNKRTSVRTIYEASIQRQPLWLPWQIPCSSSPADAPVVVFEVKADGFLYNMVRAIVGTLMRVGDGRCPPEDMARVIASLDRSAAGMTAPAAGLYLVAVTYPGTLLNTDVCDETEADSCGNRGTRLQGDGPDIQVQ